MGVENNKKDEDKKKVDGPSPALHLEPVHPSGRQQSQLNTQDITVFSKSKSDALTNLLTIVGDEKGDASDHQFQFFTPRTTDGSGSQDYGLTISSTQSPKISSTQSPAVSKGFGPIFSTSVSHFSPTQTPAISSSSSFSSSSSSSTKSLRTTVTPQFS